MNGKERATFGTKLGVILASAGSAVGLGNVWRFPYETGQNGGAAFILIYVGCVLVLGLPILLSEFVIGRHSRANTATAYRILAPGTLWNWVGKLGVLTGFLIIGYYTVVAGWTLEYTFQAVRGAFFDQSPEDYVTQFNQFTTGTWRPLFWFLLFLAATHFIIGKGVEKGIERYSKIMMPALFVILVVLVGCSLALPNADKGLRFLFQPDFSKVTGKTCLAAMGQAFFSLSVGMGCLCTYASYFSKETRLTRSAFNVVLIDTVVAVLAGLMIFPAAFSVGINPDAGAGLVFITLPNVFQQAFGSVPAIAWTVSVLFYILLALASLTSVISLYEVVTAYISERFRMPRKKAVWFVTGSCAFLGILCSLSLGHGGLGLFGMSLFDVFDKMTAKVMLPVGGFFISLFTGWYLDRKIIREELTNGGTLRSRIYRPFLFIVRYIAPVAIFFIFANETGLLGTMISGL